MNRGGSRRMLAVVLISLALGSAWGQETGNLLQRAREMASQKRYDEALAVLDQVIVAAPDDATALALRGEVFRRAGRNADARRDYEGTVRLRPDDTDAWFWLATIDRWQGRDTAALDEYGQVLELSPCHLDALKGRSRVHRKAGDDAAAEADLRLALACRDGDAEALDLLADLLSRGGRDAEARELVERSFDPPERDARLGDLAAAAGRYRDAVRHYETALAAAPENASYHRRLADAQRRRGRSDAALASYRRAAALDPDDTGSLYWIGVLGGRAGERDAALEAWDRILAEKPGDPGALTGKARLLQREGLDAEAMALLDQALAAHPDDQDARLLRGTLLASEWRTREARDAFRSVATDAPGNLDAWRGLDRVGPPRYAEVDGRYDQSRVLEGLEDAGLETSPGNVITPTRVEYLTQGLGGRVLVPAGVGHDVAGAIFARREAVSNLDTGGEIYDFDVLDAVGGMDHVLSPTWRLSWRAGGTRYSPRTTGAIAEETHFRGLAEADWRAGPHRGSLGLATDSFIWRGFAGDTDFRIFTRTRAFADWERDLGREYFVRAGASVSDFDDGNTVGALSGAFGWSRGPRGWTLRYRHDPFPARFLTDPGNNLDFIDYDLLSLSGRTPLGAGFDLDGELGVGIFGPTPRTIVAGNVKTEGPAESNSQFLARVAVTWSPGTYEPLTLGIEFLRDNYEFDTGDYNNNDLRAWTPFVQLADDVGPRWRYAVRWSHGFVSDERSDDYDADTLYGRIDVRLGRLDRLDRAPRLGIEARGRSNSLDEDAVRAAFFLRLPF